jgi:3-oxoacyl-[acyl-carrier-protein] synthase III
MTKNENNKNFIVSAGLTSLGAYIPAKKIAENRVKEFTNFLREQTLLPKEYVDSIEQQGCLPGKIETNYEGWESKSWFKEWLKILPSSSKDDPFRGAKKRRIVPMDPESVRKSLNPHPMLPSDAETIAGALAIFNGNINPDEIDLVLSHSLVPDQHLPLNASLLQHKLGLKNAGAYNINTCCSSFITMTELAASLIQTGKKKNVLIIDSVIHAHVMDRSAYFSPVFMGDAATAGLVSKMDDNYGYMSSHSTSQGSRHAAIHKFKRSPQMQGFTSHGSNHEQLFITFYDREQIKAAATNTQQDMLEVVTGTLEKVNISREEVDFLVTHQPVHWAAHTWRKTLGIPENKFYESFKKYANVAGCCVPLNLIEAIEKDLIKPDDKVLMASSGIGENHIALLHRVSSELVKNTCSTLHEEER